MRHDNTVPARIEWAPAAVPTASQDSGQDKMKRYEQFADQIAELIRRGVLAPGEKVPSVRHASRTYGVSPSTVFQAYYLLEDRGLIQARAKARPLGQRRHHHRLVLALGHHAHRRLVAL